MESGWGELNRAIQFILRDIDRLTGIVNQTITDIRSLNDSRESSKLERVELSTKLDKAQDAILDLQDDLKLLLEHTGTHKKAITDVSFKEFIVGVVVLVSTIGGLILGLFDKDMLNKVLKSIFP